MVRKGKLSRIQAINKGQHIWTIIMYDFTYKVNEVKKKMSLGVKMSY